MALDTKVKEGIAHRSIGHAYSALINAAAGK